MSPRVQLLGPFQLFRDGRPIEPYEWAGRKACQLLKILLTHRSQVVPVDQIVEWLWPNLSATSARNSLWVAVNRLRRLLEPDQPTPALSRYILTQSAGYALAASDWQIDVEDFLVRQKQAQEAESRGDLPTAISAYRAAEALYLGDYLLDDPYDEWAIPTRRKLQQTYLDLESALATCYLGVGRYHEALARCHRALSDDPCRESIWRLAMESYYRAGEQGQALRAFERCRIALSRELGVDPLPETIALHERILRDELPARPVPWQPGDPSQAKSHSSSAESASASVMSVRAPISRLPLVGRDRELASFSRLLQEVSGGRGRVVMIAGEPGIGKTRLLEEIAGIAKGRGIEVMVGRCHELEQNLAFAPIVEALRERVITEGRWLLEGTSTTALAAVAELLPELRQELPDLPAYQPLLPDQERLRLLAALAQLVRRCAHSGPLLLLLDDLHWADLSTLQLLQFLCRLSRETLLLICAYRSPEIDQRHPLSAMQSELAREGILAELALPALDEEHVVLLMRILGRSEQGSELARRLHRDTGGNPFFLDEVLRTFVQEGLITLDVEGRWHTAYDEVTDSYQELLLPSSVRAAVLGRMRGLATDDCALLHVAAVMGRGFSLPLLIHLLDEPAASLVDRVDRLVALRFLRPDLAHSYDFSHDLIRRAIYESLGESRRRMLHRQVAEALRALHTAADPTIAGRLAAQYAASDEPWLAVKHALAAAEQAARLSAYDEATAWCRQAQTIVEAHPSVIRTGLRTQVHLQWRSLWYYRGDLARTLAADRAALAAAREDNDVEAELEALWHLAHDETQVPAGGVTSGDEQRHWAQERALDIARGLGAPATLARSLARMGSDAGFMAPPSERQRVLTYLEQAVDLARQVGDSALLHEVLTELWGVGHISRARAALEEALVLAGRSDDRREEVGTLAKLADVLTRQGDFSAAATYAQKGVALAASTDCPTYGAWSQRALGQALVVLGHQADGLGHLEQAASTFEAHAWTAMLTGTLLRLGLALTSTSDWDRAAVTLERVLALDPVHSEPYEAAYALATLARVRLSRGETVEGCRLLDDTVALLPQVGLPWHRAGTLIQVAIGRLLIGDAEIGMNVATEAVDLAEREDLYEVRAWGMWVRGRALMVLGRSGEARSVLAEALARARQIGNVWLQRQVEQTQRPEGL